MFGPNSSTRTILQLRCTKLDCSVVGQARGSESSSFHNLPKPPALSEGFPQGLLMPKEEGAQNEPHPQILGEEPHLKKKALKKTSYFERRWSLAWKIFFSDDISPWFVFMSLGSSPLVQLLPEEP